MVRAGGVDQPTPYLWGDPGTLTRVETIRNTGFHFTCASCHRPELRFPKFIVPVSAEFVAHCAERRGSPEAAAANANRRPRWTPDLPPERGRSGRQPLAEQKLREVVEIVPPDIGLVEPIGEWGVGVVNAVRVVERHRGLGAGNDRIEGPY